jgi:hypothetical protein
MESCGRKLTNAWSSYPVRWGEVALAVPKTVVGGNVLSSLFSFGVLLLLVIGLPRLILRAGQRLLHPGD